MLRSSSGRCSATPARPVPRCRWVPAPRRAKPFADRDRRVTARLPVPNDEGSIRWIRNRPRHRNRRNQRNRLQQCRSGCRCTEPTAPIGAPGWSAADRCSSRGPWNSRFPPVRSCARSGSWWRYACAVAAPGTRSATRAIGGQRGPVPEAGAGPERRRFSPRAAASSGLRPRNPSVSPPGPPPAHRPPGYRRPRRRPTAAPHPAADP